MCSIKWRIMLFHLFSGMLPGEQYLSECTVPSVKFSGVGIVVLSCFSGVGLSPLARVKETLNASAYKNILQQAISCSQLCGNILGMGPSCSYVTGHQPSKQIPIDCS